MQLYPFLNHCNTNTQTYQHNIKQGASNRKNVSTHKVINLLKVVVED